MEPATTTTKVQVVKPDVFLFGCQSLAFRKQAFAALADYKQPHNPVLAGLLTHRANRIFGCTMNSITSVLDPIQESVV